MVSKLAVSSSDIDTIASFISGSVKSAGAEGVVVGLSGGLDSAVVSKLSVMALGREKVLNVFMPSAGTSADDERISKVFSESVGTEYIRIPVESIVSEFVSALGSGRESQLDRGNIAARSRMAILYNLAKKRNYLVIGTSNKSELMMGYFTKHGDGGCDIMPLAGMFKTQVRLIAKEISIPEAIISKPPSAGFWDGQTDEGEMGITYDELDSILSMFEKGMEPSEIAASAGIEKTKVSRILDSVSKAEHKRHYPYAPRL